MRRRGMGVEPSFFIFVLYESGRFGSTVVIDTTERVPTFSLAPFEKQHGKLQPGEANVLKTLAALGLTV